MGWNDFSLPACGEWYDNDDGTSRQEELSRCQPGDPLALIREPDNPHDPMAVAVFTARGIRVGYLSRERAGWIGSKMDRGYKVAAIVERIRGKGLDGSALGLVMRLSMAPPSDDLDEPQLEARPAQLARVA